MWTYCTSNHNKIIRPQSAIIGSHSSCYAMSWRRNVMWLVSWKGLSQMSASPPWNRTKCCRSWMHRTHYVREYMNWGVHSISNSLLPCCIFLRPRKLCVGLKPGQMQLSGSSDLHQRHVTELKPKGESTVTWAWQTVTIISMCFHQLIQLPLQSPLPEACWNNIGGIKMHMNRCDVWLYVRQRKELETASAGFLTSCTLSQQFKSEGWKSPQRHNWGYNMWRNTPNTY